MKIAYIGIDLFFPALESLDALGCEIVEIFTCKTDNKTEFNLKIQAFAKEHNIPCQMTRITKEDISRLQEKGCHFAICAGYYFKIPWDTNFPIVNIHPSLLPEGRGSWPMPQTILKGLQKSGVTIHKIAEGFDTGDILLQEEFSLSKDETHESFMGKVYAIIPEMMEKLILNFDEIFKNATPQGDSEYWEAPTLQDMTVTENMTVKEADLILRAFFGYECIYQGSAGNYELIRATAFEYSSNSLPLEGKVGFAKQNSDEVYQSPLCKGRGTTCGGGIARLSSWESCHEVTERVLPLKDGYIVAETINKL